MRYLYTHEESGESIEREYSMNGDIPKFVEENGKVYYRDYRNTTIQIPFQWGDLKTSFNLDKRPSGKKRFF